MNVLSAQSTLAGRGDQLKGPLTILLIFLLFLASNPAVIADWRGFSFDDGSYSHAYLIFPIIAYLYWDAHQRHELVFEPKWWFLPLLALSLYCLFVARLAQFSLLERALTPIPILFALACLFSVRFALVIPAALLWFITPIWGLLIAPLQEWSSRAVEAAMRATGIPVFVEGNFVQIPAGVFEIAEGCSGLRYVISALAIALVFCHLNFRRWQSMVLFTCLAIVGAILTNWIRILLLVLIGHYSDMQSEVIRDHNMFGWYLFIPLMLLLMFVGGRLESETYTADKSASSASRSQSVPRPALLLVTITLLGLSGLILEGIVTGRMSFIVQPVAVDELEPVAQRSREPVPVLYGDFIRRDVPAGDRSSSSAVNLPAVQVYRFDGMSPLSKPDFYLNNMVPSDWKQCGASSMRVGSAKRLEVCKGGERAIVDVVYATDNTVTGSRSEFQLHRLIRAAAFDSSSSLYWWFGSCDEVDCTAMAEFSPASHAATRAHSGLVAP